MTKSQPNINTFFLPHLSDSLPAKRFKTAFTAPKLAMKDNIIAFDSMPKSSLPIRGSTVCSKSVLIKSYHQQRHLLKRESEIV